MNFFNTIKFPIICVALFWMVELFEFIAQTNFHYLGVWPRSPHGLIGIFLSPFLHSGFTHLLSNSSSFFVLSGSIIYFYPKISTRVFLYTYLLTGLGVWIFARSSYHIGASGLVYAYASFLFFSGLFRKDTKSLILALSVAFLYNGMLYGLVPNDPGISWESHLIGAIIGAFYAYHFRNRTIGEADEQTTQHYHLPEEGYQALKGKQFRYVYKENDEADKHKASDTL